jgi:hypothetical protein
LADKYDASLKGLLSPLPPRRLRVDLLKEFTTLHSWSIEKATHAALLLQGGVSQFEYKGRFLQFTFDFRPNFNSNPAMAFALKDAQFRPLSDIDASPGEKAAFEAGRPMRDESEARLRASDDAFAGILIVAYVMEDFFLWHSAPQFNLPAWFDARVMAMQMDWLDHLKRVVQAGIVYRQRRDRQDLPAWHLGRMERNRSKWRWVALRDEELAAIGIGPNSPGQLF